MVFALEDFIRKLFADPDMLRMGHHQRAEDLNLGLGWLYYSMVRIIRPEQVVVIGSYRGFAPLVMAKALLDNGGAGRICFIDPSLADDFWMDADAVRRHFMDYGIGNVIHHRCTTQEFIATEPYSALPEVGLLMVDGYHSAEQARFDYLAFLEKLSDTAVVLFHDSIYPRYSPIYDREKPYLHTVHQFMARLRETPGIELFNLPHDSGLSLVRGRPATLDFINAPFSAPPEPPQANVGSG